VVAGRPGHAVTEESDRRTVPVLAKVLGVLGLVLAVVGTVLFIVPSRGGDPSDSAEAKQVVSRVNDFAIAYNTYDVADPKEYQARLKGLLTTDYNAEFVKITDALFVAIKDKKQKSGEAVVYDVAVESIDGDSAVALVVVDAKVTNTDNENAILRQFRWTVKLQKVSGKWRVFQFASVAARPADEPDPATPGPSDSASPDASPSPTVPSEGEGE